MSAQLDKLQTMLAQLSFWEGKIKEALEYTRGTHDFDDVVGMILQGRFQFFPYGRCFFITEKVSYPKFSVFHCFLAGGEAKAMLEHHATMEQIGREAGCRYLSMSGRRGWEPIVTKAGWQQVSTTFYLDLEGTINGKGWDDRNQSQDAGSYQRSS